MEPTAMSDNNDFLQPLLDMMSKRMDSFEKKLDDNEHNKIALFDKLETKLDANTVTTQQVLEQARYTNGRVTRAEKAIVRLEAKKGKKFSMQPNVLYLVALGFVLLLTIIASILHINIGGLIK